MVESGDGKRGQNSLSTKDNNDHRSTTENRFNTNSLPILYHQQEHTGPTISTPPGKDEITIGSGGVTPVLPRPIAARTAWLHIHLHLLRTHKTIPRHHVHNEQMANG